MGQRAIKLAEIERYIAEVQGMLRGETVEALLEGENEEDPLPEPGARPDQHRRSKIPLHVSAFGPKARALVAKLGAGWLLFAGGVGARARRARATCRRPGSAAGRSDRLYATRSTRSGCVLRPGESPTSKRALAQAGAARGGVLPRPGRARARSARSSARCRRSSRAAVERLPQDLRAVRARRRALARRAPRPPDVRAPRGEAVPTREE